MDIDFFLLQIRECMFLCGLLNWIPKWNRTPPPDTHRHTHAADIRRGSKEKWLDLGLQSRTFSHPHVRETGLLNVHTCDFSPKTCLECTFSKIPSAGLFTHFLVSTLLPFPSLPFSPLPVPSLSFYQYFPDELFLFPGLVVFLFSRT